MTTHLQPLYQKYEPFCYANLPQEVTKYLNRYNDTNLTSISNKMMAQHATRLILQITEFPGIYDLQFTFSLENLGADNNNLDGANRRGQLLRNYAGDPCILRRAGDDAFGAASLDAP
eukprot:Skav226328  [mRNA]  locus=scaffold4486:7568:7918:+ [translate_table: standard]